MYSLKSTNVYGKPFGEKYFVAVVKSAMADKFILGQDMK
jgi:hypothetical protein